MSKRALTFDLAMITVDRGDSLSMVQQLYNALRTAILSHTLKPGTRLPSTRRLSTDLGVSRNTISATFDQLRAEGYLECRVGDGTYISSQLPDELLTVHQGSPDPAKRRSEPDATELSVRYKTMQAMPTGGMDSESIRPFRTGIPALDAFPINIWTRLTTRRWRTVSTNLLSYESSPGYYPLREAISEYLGSARGVNCRPDQVFVTSGSQDALSVACSLLLNPGDQAWIEDPAYRGGRLALVNAGVEVIPVPVDSEGLNVAEGINRAPLARMAYVTPSYQYPCGVTMPLSRRLELLKWAQNARAWILEDDYNSEYRFSGRPLASLQGLDTNERVLYIGTFSKVLFPSLRIGYLIVPPTLVDSFARAMQMMFHYSPLVDQAVLCDFISQGHFARHVRRMRSIYAERRLVLDQELQQVFEGALQVDCAAAGMHIMARLAGANAGRDTDISVAAGRHGLQIHALSTYALRRLGQGGLVLGYGAYTPRELRLGVRKLRTIIRENGITV